MATIIDSLLVTLGLDSSAYDKGAEKVKKSQEELASKIKKDSKEVEDASKKTADSQHRHAERFQKDGKEAVETFGKIRNHVLSLMALLAGGVGMVEFARSTILNAAAVGRFSENIGMGIKSLQGWEYAARSVGATGSDMAHSLESAASALANLKYNGIVGPQIESFFRYGGGKFGMPKDAQEMMRDEVQMVSALYKSGHHNEARTRWEQMGNSDATFNLAKEGLKKWNEEIAQGKKRAPYTFLDSVKAQQEIRVLNNFRTTLEGVAVSIGYKFLPVFNAFLDKLKSWADWALTHESTIDGWAQQFASAIEAIGREANKAAQFVGGWHVVLEGLLALKVLSWVSGIVRMTSALTGLAGVLARIAGLGGASTVIGMAARAVGGGALAMAYSQKLNPGEGKATGQAERRVAVMNKLQSMGYSRKMAAAITANAMTESGLNPTAVGDNGQAYGMFQWHPARQAAYQKFIGHNIRSGTPAQQADRQLRFMQHELAASYGTTLSQMHATPSAYWKAYLFAQGYERPADIAKQGDIRGKLADRYMADPASSYSGRAMPITTAQRLGARQAPNIQNSHSIANSSQVHVDNITVHTQATDAPGIAREIHGALNRLIMPQMNTGLT